LGPFEDHHTSKEKVSPEMKEAARQQGGFLL
jgi:hypothetical protein